MTEDEKLEREKRFEREMLRQVAILGYANAGKEFFNECILRGRSVAEWCEQMQVAYRDESTHFTILRLGPAVYGHTSEKNFTDWQKEAD